MPMSQLEMLRTPRDFAALQSGGRSRGHALMSVRLRRNELGRDRFAISTGRRVGGAVVRNQVRRRIKEILRHSVHPATLGWDVLVICRPASAVAAYGDLREALARLVVPGTREG